MGIFDWIDGMKKALWGGPVLILILTAGILISVMCRFPQIRLLPRALNLLGQCITQKQARKNGSYRALCTALAGTVGTGNIAGVAGAITLGGPGAVFWMWVSAFLGMAVKYAESVLAVRYRTENSRGDQVGGPMYWITLGLPAGLGWMASAYAFCGLAAGFGVGNATQVNAILSAVSQTCTEAGFRLPWFFPILAAFLLGAILIRSVREGSGKIGKTAEQLMPAVTGLYLFMAAAVLVCRRAAIPEALGQIILGVFRPEAVMGGSAAGVFSVMCTGISRGTFTNEAGMGTSAMAHAETAETDPARQGLFGILEVFLDTAVICTLTALVILTAPVSVPYGTASGAELTAAAFSSVLGLWGSGLLCLCLCVFAFGTILGWGLYAGRCAEFLFGRICWSRFALLQGAGVLLGAVLDTGTVWSLSELFNGLMALPSLTALLYLMPEIRRLTGRGQKRTGKPLGFMVQSDSPPGKSKQRGIL